MIPPRMSIYTCTLLLLAVASSSVAAVSEDMQRFAGLSPVLADTLREAQAATQRQVAVLPEPAARSNAWGRLGMFYHAQHLPYAAEGAYSQALAEAEDARWRYLRAIALSERGELNLAIADYRQVSQTDPGNMAAWYRLGAGLLVVGDLDAALAALQEARKRAPDSAIVLSALADVAVAREQFSQALELLTRAQSLAPEAGQVAYKLAMVYRRTGNLPKAQEWLARRAGNSSTPEIDDPLLLEVAQMSRSGRFFVKAGEWALERGETEQALAAFETAASLAPEDPATGLAFATALLLNDRHEEAQQEVKRVLEVDPDSARGWYTLAWLLRTSHSAEEQAEALGAARTSLALQEDLQTRTLIAALLMRAGRFGAAVDDYSELVRRQPTQAYYHFWLGMALLASEDCAARPALVEALRLQKSWGEAHLVLARTDAICGHAQAARRRAEALLAVKDDSDMRLTMAFVELSLGRNSIARELALAELPNNPDARILLDALDQDKTPLLPFATGSAWWLPPEIR